MFNWQPHDSFGGLVIRVGKQLSETASLRLKKNVSPDMTVSRMGVLVTLYDNTRSQAEICRILGHKAPSVSEILLKLEKMRAVQKIPDPHHLSRHLWQITSTGKNFVTASQQTLNQLGEQIDSLLAEMKVTPKELDRLKKMLKNFDKGFFS